MLDLWTLDYASIMSDRKKLLNRLWRYLPLVAWMATIFFASTSELSAANTSRIIRPLLIWLFPDITEARLQAAHFLVRKAAHFSEYAIFAVLAARAFAGSTHERMRNAYFALTFALIIFYSLADEFHQAFVPGRTGSIYDSFIDMSGGFIALLAYAVWRNRSNGPDGRRRAES